MRTFTEDQIVRGLRRWFGAAQSQSPDSFFFIDGAVEAIVVEADRDEMLHRPDPQQRHIDFGTPGRN